MIIFLLTVSLCLLLLVVGLLLYIGYKIRQFEDTQEVIFDAAVNAEEMYKDIEMNQEAIMNAYSRQNWVQTENIFTFFWSDVLNIQK